MKLLLVCLFFAYGIPLVSGQNWVHRQGPVRNGTVPWESQWRGENWELGKPLCTARVGNGGSSPIVANGFVYTLGWKDDLEILWHLDANTGEPKWNGKYECEPYGRFAIGDQSLYKGPASTADAGHEGTIACYQL